MSCGCGQNAPTPAAPSLRVAPNGLVRTGVPQRIAPAAPGLVQTGVPQLVPQILSSDPLDPVLVLTSPGADYSSDPGGWAGGYEGQAIPVQEPTVDMGPVAAPPVVINNGSPSGGSSGSGAVSNASTSSPSFALAGAGAGVGLLVLLLLLASDK